MRDKSHCAANIKVKPLKRCFATLTSSSHCDSGESSRCKMAYATYICPVTTEDILKGLRPFQGSSHLRPNYVGTV